MGSLALAGAISGAGEAAGKALQTAQAGWIQSELLKERDRMEIRRLELMEQSATSREKRGYAHTETLEAGRQKFQTGLEEQRQTFEVGKQAQEFEHQERSADQVRADAKARLDEELRARGTIARAEITSVEKRSQNELALQEKRLRQEGLATTPTVLGDGSIAFFDKQGRLARMATDKDGNPLKAPKDLPAQQKFMAETYIKMMDAPIAVIKDKTSMPDEKQRASEHLNELRDAISTLLGQPAKTPETPTVKDRFAKEKEKKTAAVSTPPPPGLINKPAQQAETYMGRPAQPEPPPRSSQRGTYLNR